MQERLIGALSLLQVPEIVGKIEDTQKTADEVNRLWPVAVAVERMGMTNHLCR